MNANTRGNWTSFSLFLLLFCLACQKQDINLNQDIDNFTPNAPLPQEDLNAIITEGMIAWRAVGSIQAGAACANCHAPDGLDLAYFNFSDETILRRAADHLPAEQSVSIVNMVHALRQRYRINPKDPMTHPPFQPGGTILSGQTVGARDLAFGRQLQQKGFRFATQKVLSREEAISQMVEWLIEVDIRSLPIGIPLNRWSEDPAHGGEHASIADWLPDLPFLPTTSAWYAMQDQYLAQPTDGTFLAMYDQVDAFTETTFDGNSAELMQRKYKSVLVAQHLFRQEVVGGVPLPGRPSAVFYPMRMNEEEKGPNPIWDVGDWARVFHSGNPPEFPDGIINRISPESDLKNELRKIKVPWFWAGWLMDQTLQRTSGSNSTKSAEYFTKFLNTDWDEENEGKSGYSIHDIFMITKKLVMQNFDQVTQRSHDRFFMKYSNFHGYGWDIKHEPQDPERQQIYRFLVENSYRMMLFLLQDHIERHGYEPGDPEKWLDTIERMEAFFKHTQSVDLEFNLNLIDQTRRSLIP